MKKKLFTESQLNIVNRGIQARIEPVPIDLAAIDGAILEESVMSAGNMENDDKYMDSLNT